MSQEQVTRGHGRLEGFLSRRRAAMADKLTPQSLRDGLILDIGCGHFPYYLSQTTFNRKIGVDQQIEPGTTLTVSDVELRHFDAKAEEPLPIEDTSCDVVTMLAVFEHIPHDALVTLLNDIHRVLKPSGLFIMTTPNRWADFILQILSRTGMVSHEEIDEHETVYNLKMIRDVINETSLDEGEIRQGTFECFMNTWTVVRK